MTNFNNPIIESSDITIQDACNAVSSLADSLLIITEKNILGVNTDDYQIWVNSTATGIKLLTSLINDALVQIDID
ncbi:MAG: hypothetical protein Q9M28_02700 [Mariprofundaceae bacterium]|nr:hypothetical protein [Mariprofundaceae bacterium]